MYEEKNVKLKKIKQKGKQLKQQKSKEINYKIDKLKNKYTFLEPIDIKKILKQISILIILIIIIIFITSNMNKPSKKSVFENNINKINEYSLNYFEYNLPFEIGETSVITLKDLRQIVDIPTIYDHKEKVCDSNNSYLNITKISSNEYRLITYLNCNKNSMSKETIINCIEQKCLIKENS